MRIWFPWLVAAVGVLVMVLTYVQGYQLGVWIDEHAADGIDLLPLFGLGLIGLVLLLTGLTIGLTELTTRSRTATAGRHG